MAVLLESNSGFMGRCPVLVTHAEVQGDIVRGITLVFKGYYPTRLGSQFNPLSIKTGRTYSYRKLPALLRYVKTSVKQTGRIGCYELKTPFSSVAQLLDRELFFLGERIYGHTNLGVILSEEKKINELATNFRVVRLPNGTFCCGDVRWNSGDSTEEIKERLVNRVHSLLSIDDFHSIRKMFRGL